jgi:threonine dehydratase
MGSSSPLPSTLPLTASSIREAHALIAPYIHRTPLLTCATLDRLASTPLENESIAPKFNLYFKAENLQKIGAFKARGAHHALIRLIERLGIDEVKRRGVVTHSSGNHAQALALAARTFDVPAYIVMPRISTPSKISGTRYYTEHVIFSGSTSVEREAVVEEVMQRTNAILVPPYDAPDIVLGQGTVGCEMDEQFKAMRGAERRSREEEAERKRVRVKEARSKGEFETGMDGWFERMKSGMGLSQPPEEAEEPTTLTGKNRAACSAALPRSPPSTSDIALDAVIAPIGGGGLLGGIATYFSSPTSSKPKTLVFGAEPQFEGANDAERGLGAGKRVEHVSTLTIADGLRTPVGLINWEIVSNKNKVEGIYSVTESQIKDTMRLVFERMKLVVEPSGCVPLAVVLFNEEFRGMVAERQREQGAESWDVGVVFSGGNTTMDAIVALYSEGKENGMEREEGKVAMDGRREVEHVAG